MLVLDLLLELLYIAPQTLLALREQIRGAIATVDVVGRPCRYSRMTVVVRRWSDRRLLALRWVRSVLGTGQRVRSAATYLAKAEVAVLREPSPDQIHAGHMVAVDTD